ncbi:P-loop containing nucleoside triphosphate hydrolase protein, partial [Cryphonectria parasitica EP155]
ALEHIQCLIDFIDKYITPKRTYLQGTSYETVYFSDLWHLFQIGDIVLDADGKQAYQVVRVKSSKHRGANRWTPFQNGNSASKQESISIQCVYVSFDGKLLGPVSEWFTIRKYDGERNITALPIYPLRFRVHNSLSSQGFKPKDDDAASEDTLASGVAELEQSLIKRGKLFVDVAGVKHMYYAGLTVDARDEVESQVVIDTEEGIMNMDDKWRPRITRLLGATNDHDTNSEADEEECTAECCRRERVHLDAYVEDKLYEEFINNAIAEIQDTPHKLPSVAIFPRNLAEIQTEDNELKDKELLIMASAVPGYVLRDRTWGINPAEKIIAPDDDSSDDDDHSAFGRLVLPKGHKEMVLSLISQHFRNKASQKYQEEQVDIVRGKGMGLIILLHGAPGVGKTTTAEGVAERFHKPLFQITCGDLGSDAAAVESSLQTNFALANRWDCILLLDEADVFLAERRREDFTRNGLVAVFLRVLEYYSGILFLTTNRIGDFDEAFASRIHMSLYYPPLDEISTSKVFKLNLGMIRARYGEKGKKIKIDEVEIMHLVGHYWRHNSKARWNGRQIRNACQTALALAEFDAQPKEHKYDLKPANPDLTVHLTVAHLETVSKAYLEFIEYLKAVHGTDADTHAKESGFRA